MMTTTSTREKKFEGSKYQETKDLNIKDIAKLVRDELKETFPGCKFSVTKESYSMGRSLNVNLMSGPFNPFNDIENIEDEEDRQRWKSTIEKRHCDVNHFYINDSKILSFSGKVLMSMINQISSSYNYDNSDIQTDYFENRYYFHLLIGKWDKPFEITKN